MEHVEKYGRAGDGDEEGRYGVGAGRREPAEDDEMGHVRAPVLARYVSILRTYRYLFPACHASFVFGPLTMSGLLRLIRRKGICLAAVVLAVRA